jgi:hypothetical protein
LNPFTFTISKVHGAGDICTTTCDATPGCTHFNWKGIDNNGTCFLKSGKVTKLDAFYDHDVYGVCGFCETCLGKSNKKLVKN